MKLTDEQIEEIKDTTVKVLASINLKSQGDMGEVKKRIRSQVRNYLDRKVRVNPMILPLITEL